MIQDFCNKSCWHSSSKENWFKSHTVGLKIFNVSWASTKPRLPYGTRRRLHCPFFTEMALSAVLTLVLPRPSKVRIISTIRARKLLSHSSTPWTVKPRWAGTSWCCFSTRTVLPFITDVTLWSIKQISSTGVCSRKARKFGCWACPCENKVKFSYCICFAAPAGYHQQLSYL